MPHIDASTCREAFARLEDYIDRELPAQELDKVEQHLAICEICAPEFAFEERVLGTIREKLVRIEVPASLQQRISRLIAAERR
jgi:anti-sigma factor (TIGR02949 family)